MRSFSFSLRPLRWASRPTSPAPPSHPRLRCSLLGLGRTPWSPTHPSLRPRWPARSSPPPPPSAPVLRFAVFPPPTTNSAQQPLDSLLHLFPNHVADHSDQTLSSRHQRPSLGGGLFVGVAFVRFIPARKRAGLRPRWSREEP